MTSSRQRIEAASANSANPGATTPEGRSKATVAAGFVTGMLAGLARLRHDPVPLLTAAGIDDAVLRDPTVRVPVDRYATLYNRVNAALDDEAFGLLSTPWRLGSFEFLCRGAVTAPTLEDALRRAVRFLRLLTPDLAVEIDRSGDAATLSIVERRPLAVRPDDPGRVFAFEWLLRLLHGLACWLVGRGIALDAVAFPYPRPAHADDYALIYTEHSSFEASRLVASFRANLLDLPVRRDEPALAAFLDGAPGKISMLYRRDREMVLRVRDRLRQSLAENPSLEDVAARLLLSPRTLHRRLADEGANFRAIKEALRRDLALARMAKSGQPVSAVALELGYADTSAFYRAFVDWTGLSPARYRRQLAAPR